MISDTQANLTATSGNRFSEIRKIPKVGSQKDNNSIYYISKWQKMQGLLSLLLPIKRKSPASVTVTDFLTVPVLAYLPLIW